MKTYTILLAQNIPHYGTTEIQAADAAEAVERAKDLDFDNFLLIEPDWENPVCRRIVSITDDTGVEVAHDIVLDGYVLRHSKAPLPRHSHIRVFVLGGVVQGAETLDGERVLVEVIDYDTDGCDPQTLGADPNDEPCCRYTI